MERRAEEVRAETQALLERLGAPVELELPTGPVEDEILNRADEETLVVLGKEGGGARTGGAARLGSVAERVARRAKGAVLLVPQTLPNPGDCCSFTTVRTGQKGRSPIRWRSPNP